MSTLYPYPHLDFDTYFMQIAAVVATKSTCWSRQIGAVLVKDKAIISTGYNGPPRGMSPCKVLNDFGDLYEYKCPRREQGYKSGEGLHLCPAAHAERNALIQAARTGVSTMGSTLYCHCEQVCKECASEIVNAGVKRLVFLDGLPPYDKLAGRILSECKIEVVKIKMET